MSVVTEFPTNLEGGGDFPGGGKSPWGWKIALGVGNPTTLKGVGFPGGWKIALGVGNPTILKGVGFPRGQHVLYKKMVYYLHCICRQVFSLPSSSHYWTDIIRKARN